MKSTLPVYLSVDKKGNGTLALQPGKNKATVTLTINGKEQVITIGPDEYVQLGQAVVSK